jgi:asparagine synthase (glutamine-hydrolysing)
VRCFAYGRPGNFEAKASRAIAERLGYKWRFVPTRIGAMRRYFGSELHARYLAYSDSAQATPFEQDLPQILRLKEDGYVPADAVLCNGSTGDYISGAHIVPAMQEVASGLSHQARRQRIVDALIDKHFALWRSLMTPANRAAIARQLEASLARAGAALADPADDYGLYEYVEFQNRQCKYVIAGQRIYDFLGHDWRLPLWARPYLDFWEGVPLAGKAKQRLYAAMLDERNWGGVWRGLPVNARTIRPHWIRPLRFLAKLAHAPLGKERWHRFERRYFQYWMSALGGSAIVGYARAAADERGARSEISWLTENYLSRHGLRLEAFAR